MTWDQNFFFIDTCFKYIFQNMYRYSTKNMYRYRTKLNACEWLVVLGATIKIRVCIQDETLETNFIWAKSVWENNNNTCAGWATIPLTWQRTLSAKKMIKTLKAFKNWDLNIIVSTSVLEGVNIRICNLVIRFDKPKTLCTVKRSSKS